MVLNTAGASQRGSQHWKVKRVCTVLHSPSLGNIGPSNTIVSAIGAPLLCSGVGVMSSQFVAHSHMLPNLWGGLGWGSEN